MSRRQIEQGLTHWCFFSAVQDAERQAGGVATIIPKLGCESFHREANKVVPGRVLRLQWQHEDRCFIHWNVHRQELSAQQDEIVCKALVDKQKKAVDDPLQMLGGGCW